MVETSENNIFIKKMASRVESILNEIPDEKLIEQLEKTAEKLNFTVEIKQKNTKPQLRVI